MKKMIVVVSALVILLASGFQKEASAENADPLKPGRKIKCSSNGSWCAESYMDPIYDVRRVFIFSQAASAQGNQSRPDVWLIVRCATNFVEVLLDLNNPAYQNKDDLTNRVTLRFDKYTPYDEVWNLAYSNDALFRIGTAETFIDKLLRNKNLTMRVSAQGKAKTYIFNLTGLNEVIGQLDCCGDAE